MLEKRVGIMGGTFNPIHFAHLSLAEFAREQFAFDEVMFLPSKKPVHKSNHELIDDHHRYNMVKLAIDGHPQFYVSDIELKRDGNTYTIDTLHYLHENTKNIAYFFIIGGDSLVSFEKWKSADEILGLCHIIAASRGGYDAHSIKAKINELNTKYNADIQYLDLPAMDISSRMIRERLKNGQTARYLMPESVIDYIHQHHLYCEEV